MRKLIKFIFSKETLLYIVYGVCTSLVDFIAFTALVYMEFGSITSNNIAWCLAVIFAFITNKIFVFNSKVYSLKILIKEIIMFVSGRLFTLICTDLILKAADILNANVLAAKIWAMLFTVIVNYIFSKLIIFRKTGDSDGHC